MLGCLRVGLAGVSAASIRALSRRSCLCSIPLCPYLHLLQARTAAPAAAQPAAARPAGNLSPEQLAFLQRKRSSTPAARPAAAAAAGVNHSGSGAGQRAGQASGQYTPEQLEFLRRKVRGVAAGGRGPTCCDRDVWRVMSGVGLVLVSSRRLAAIATQACHSSAVPPRPPAWNACCRAWCPRHRRRRPPHGQPAPPPRGPVHPAGRGLPAPLGLGLGRRGSSSSSNCRRSSWPF